MDCISTYLPYQATHQFSPLLLDYLKEKTELRSFYSHPVSVEGIRSAIKERKKFPTNRAVLKKVMEDYYAKTSLSARQSSNLEALLSENTFTVCTAHQPNIFTGYLYFIYKTIHIIRMADDLKKEMPEYNFVPVFYIGSEDNDLDELSRVNLNGVKLKWDTSQSGAVGRMKVDKKLISLISDIEVQIATLDYGQELLKIIRDSYREGVTIAEATFRLLNSLFRDYGLLVLQPDHPDLKMQMKDVFRDDLFEHLPHRLVENNNAVLGAEYKLQVNPREINLFYLEDDVRERIIGNSQTFRWDNSTKALTREEIEQMLDNSPEKFSPNVVLRGLYQETIMPNIAFVGGGSEVAYWLELKPLFEHYGVPYPVIVLRNSFLLVTKEQEEKVKKLGWQVSDLFGSVFDLMNAWVSKYSGQHLDLSTELKETENFYAILRENASKVDPTLAGHVSAIGKKAITRLEGLQKKLVRAEKRKFEALQRQVEKAKLELFPGNGLQERVDNFIPWYARYGKDFFDCIYKHSSSFRQEFGIIHHF